MAITYVGKSTFASGTAGLTVAAVAGVQANDLILLFVESANQAVTTPTGYTQVTGSPVSTGTAAAAGGVRLTSFYRIATGADATVSVADSGDHTTAIKVVYRGVDTATPFDATPVTGIKTPASTSSSFPGITTATANAWVVHASALDLDAASTATTGAATNANLTGITERHDQTVASGVGGGLVIIDGVKATAGATGNTTATVTSTIQVYTTIALRAAVLAARTGTLAATETGSDTFASNGDVFVKGSLAVSETGNDVFAASGTVSDPTIVGSLAVSEVGSDALASTGKVIVKGSLSVSETGQDTFTSNGDVFVKGSLAVTEGSDTFAATGQGTQIAQGSLAVTEAGLDSFTGTGDVFVKGSLSVSEASDVFACSGGIIITGNLTATEAGLDTFEAVSGVVARIGTMGAVESGGVGFGVNAVMKFYDGSSWQILYKDPTIYV